MKRLIWESARITIWLELSKEKCGEKKEKDGEVDRGQIVRGFVNHG